jgi:hypothetical protein
LESEHGQLPDLIILKKQLAFFIEVKHRWNAKLIFKQSDKKTVNGQCSICHSQGFLRCFEKWDYDNKNKIQILASITALCGDCYSVKRYGQSKARGKEAQARAHFLKINGCSETTLDKYLKKMEWEYRTRSQYQWTVNLTWLEQYDIHAKGEAKEIRAKNSYKIWPSKSSYLDYLTKG